MLIQELQGGQQRKAYRDAGETYYPGEGRAQATVANLGAEFEAYVRQERGRCQKVASGNSVAMEVGNADDVDAEFEEVIGTDLWEELAKDAVLQRALAATAEQ